MKDMDTVRTLLAGTVVALFVFTLSSNAGAQTCVPAPAGLVSWWPGDGDANDIVDGNPGTLQSGATFAAGKVGQAFSFAASGDMVQVAHNPNLNLESLAGSTFEGWFKSSGGSVFGDGLVIAKHTCGVAAGWFFTTDQGCFIGDHHVGGYGIGPLNLDDGLFHHFACVKDGTTYREYVDGVLISQSTGPAMGTPVTEPVQIGSITTGTGANGCVPSKHQLFGLVDELEIYSRALSDAEILAVFNAGSAGKCKDEDGDGFRPPEDCNEASASINPNATELPGNFVDENCDGDLGSCSPCFAWNTHGEYVRCVSRAVESLVTAGALTEEEGDALVGSAARSDIGKKGFVPAQCQE